MGYHRAGFDIVGVDNRPQPRYPFTFHQGDALAWLERHGADGYDVIHASPPCQAYATSATGRTARRKDQQRKGEQLALVPRHADLVAAVRAALEATGLPYVIENVPGAPLIDPIVLCGSSFELDVRRHRLFESNVRLFAPACKHSRQSARFDSSDTRMAPGRARVVSVFGNPNHAGDLDLRRRAMGIEWMDNHELTQAIPPAYTEHLGRQLVAHLCPTV